MDSPTTSSDAVDVVKAIVGVGALFTGIAHRLRDRPDVLKVHRECWMQREDRSGSYVHGLGEGEGFGIEWYTDADFADDDRSLSFQFEVRFLRGGWLIEANVRAIEWPAQEVLVELPTLTTTHAAELAEQLAAQCARLADNEEEAIRLFRAGRGG